MGIDSKAESEQSEHSSRSSAVSLDVKIHPQTLFSVFNLLFIESKNCKSNYYQKEMKVIIKLLSRLLIPVFTLLGSSCFTVKLWMVLQAGLPRAGLRTCVNVSFFFNFPYRGNHCLFGSWTKQTVYTLDQASDNNHLPETFLLATYFPEQHFPCSILRCK